MEHDPNRLRLERKLLHTTLQASKIREYHDSLDYHVNTFLASLLQDPNDFFHHIRQYVTEPRAHCPSLSYSRSQLTWLYSLSAGVTIEISHGYRVLTRNDAYVKQADAFGENFADATLPNNYIVDWLPFRRSLVSIMS